MKHKSPEDIKIESLANLLANSGFGEFNTYSHKMPLGDVKKAFKDADLKIRANGLHSFHETQELVALKRFEKLLGLK